MTQQTPGKDYDHALGVFKNLRLAWRLVRDPLVPVWTKLIPLATVAYIVLPVDIIPDVIIGLGQLDDLGIFILGIKLFVDLCPAETVRRHLADMSSIRGQYRVVQDDKPMPNPPQGYLAERSEVSSAPPSTDIAENEQQKPD